MTRTGEGEIGAVHETVMPFLKPDVKKKKKKKFENFSFHCLFCLTLLLTASNVIFDLGLLDPNQIYKDLNEAGLEDLRENLILPRNASFWQVGLLDIALFRIPDKFHYFTN